MIGFLFNGSFAVSLDQIIILENKTLLLLLISPTLFEKSPLFYISGDPMPDTCDALKGFIIPDCMEDLARPSLWLGSDWPGPTFDIGFCVF